MCIRDSNRAPGRDGVTYEVMKALPYTTVVMLTRLYNECLRAHEVPEEWKMGLVSMLYKKGETDDCKNYRGLTLLAVAGKVFERVLLPRLSDHVEHNGLMHELQYGFRGERGTGDLVVVLQQALEHNPNACAVFVDVRKAYPTVFREGLFTKLAQKGITGGVWALLMSWYSGLKSKLTVA